MFLMQCDKAADILNKVEECSLQNGISANSLDMWYSRTGKRHWSFGVTFINDDIDFWSIFKENRDREWMKRFADIEINFNLDWFFTYLKQYKKVDIRTFAVNHAWFVHWGDFLINPLYGWINRWENGKIHYPIMENIYQNQELGCIDSLADWTIDTDASTEEAVNILENRICKSRYFKEQ